MSTIQLYAELLLHIRSVNFFASLQTEHNHDTRAHLSADSERITLSHEGQSASIRLPTKVGGGGDAILTLPAAPSKEITLRLQLEETSPGLLQFADQGSGNIEPWTAESLSQQTDLFCRSCGQIFFSRKQIDTWKDLPSENWAEMMEFWHCHKPPKEDSTEDADAASRKGYSASSKLRASSGTGFVDPSTFLLAPNDGSGIQLQEFGNESNAVPPNRILLHCDCCNAEVGCLDGNAEGWRLYKWAVSVAQGDLGVRVAFSLEKWISSRILAYVENESTRHFHVHSGSKDPHAISLLLWVFSPDISFSSSTHAEDRHDPTRAVKVMWQDYSDSTDKSNQPTFRYESLELPANVVFSMQQALRGSQKLLPSSSRIFNEWSVGLLQRFSIYDK
ncbi:MAG: hypothetical protein M1821_007144 [Bathelium mastoideum]|nr:MAG: hypothetical protein M1821_007144 [Bathelium mastoideum]KAI9694654.1 MAG: hypothetical protein M1822_000270 [Bathelium mastoideum]